MKCGEKPGGWRTKAGELCQQTVSSDPNIAGCPYHAGDPARVKQFQQRGGLTTAIAWKTKKGALPEDTPALALGTVEEIDQEIQKALEQLRRGQFGERKAEVLIAALQKLRASRVEERALAPKAPVTVSYGWKLQYCESCTCRNCEAFKRRYAPEPEPASSSDVA
jgi:hypothetical protein